MGMSGVTVGMVGCGRVGASGVDAPAMEDVVLAWRALGAGAAGDARR